MTSTYEIGFIADFPEGSMKAVEVDGQDILIIHQNSKVYALPNQCTHAKFPLDDGDLLEGKVKCQYHGATYNLETGAATLPAIKKIKLFTVSVKDDVVFVNLQEN